MHIDTTVDAANHAKAVINEVRQSDDLPFREILPASLLTRHLVDLEYRDRIFTPDLTIFGFLAQVTGEDQSCQQAVTQVVAHLARCGGKMPSNNTAAYCKARARLPEKTLAGLAKETAEELEKKAEPRLLWRNRHIKLPDGTTVSMPDTPANQAAYPQTRTQKKGLVFRWRAWWVSFHSQQVPCLIWRWRLGLEKVRVNIPCFASGYMYSVLGTS